MCVFIRSEAVRVASTTK